MTRGVVGVCLLGLAVGVAGVAGPGGVLAQGNQIAPTQLLGTLAIESDITLRSGNALEREWIFVNDELVGQLPVDVKKLVTPGRYDIRIVRFYSAEETDLPGLGYWQAYFRTLHWQVTATVGQVAAFRKSFILFPRCDWPDSWWGAVSCTDSDVLLYKKGDFFARRPRPYDGSAQSQEEVSRLLEQLPAKTATMLQSPGWKAIETFSRTPPARRTAYVALPEELGGGREIDAAQLEFLRRWFLIRFDQDWNVVGQLFGGLQESALDSRARALYRRYVDTRRSIDDFFVQLIAQLQKAPEN